MSISEKNMTLIERVINTIDWELIYKLYKLVNRTVGSETTQIQGIKKLPKGTKLSEEHIKEEVLCLINHVVRNDISQFMYGPWEITWINGEWEMEMDRDDEYDENNGENGGENEPEFMPLVESILEVRFSPMIVISKEVVVDEKTPFKDPGTRNLQDDLKKALESEDYELASKIRDLIDIYKNKK